MLPNDSVIDHSGASVLGNNIINEATILSAAVLTSSKIFNHEYIMWLNDPIALTTL